MTFSTAIEARRFLDHVIGDVFADAGFQKTGLNIYCKSVGRSNFFGVAIEFSKHSTRKRRLVRPWFFASNRDLESLLRPFCKHTSERKASPIRKFSLIGDLSAGLGSTYFSINYMMGWQPKAGKTSGQFWELSAENEKGLRGMANCAIDVCVNQLRLYRSSIDLCARFLGVSRSNSLYFSPSSLQGLADPYQLLGYSYSCHSLALGALFLERTHAECLELVEDFAPLSEDEKRFDRYIRQQISL